MRKDGGRLAGIVRMESVAGGKISADSRGGRKAGEGETRKRQTHMLQLQRPPRLLRLSIRPSKLNRRSASSKPSEKADPAQRSEKTHSLSTLVAEDPSIRLCTVHYVLVPPRLPPQRKDVVEGERSCVHRNQGEGEGQHRVHLASCARRGAERCARREGGGRTGPQDANGDEEGAEVGAGVLLREGELSGRGAGLSCSSTRPSVYSYATARAKNRTSKHISE